MKLFFVVVKIVLQKYLSVNGSSGPIDLGTNVLPFYPLPPFSFPLQYLRDPNSHLNPAKGLGAP